MISIMNHLHTHEYDMEQRLNEMQETLVSLREFRDELVLIKGRWDERIERINGIEARDWSNDGKTTLDQDSRDTLEVLRQTAQRRSLRDEERLYASNGILTELESRFKELQRAAKKFRIYNTVNSIERSQEMSDGVGADIKRLMDDSKQLAFQADAFIEIEAGKNVQ